MKKSESLDNLTVGADTTVTFSSEKYAKLSESLQSILEGSSSSQWTRDVKFTSDPKKPPGRRRRKKVSKSKDDIFHRITLNKDPNCAKYMPYEEVSYPKLKMEPLQKEANEASLESMWMVGFLDNDIRTKDKQIQAEISKYLQMPGGAPPPPKVQAMLNKYSKNKQAQQAEEDSSPRDPTGMPSTYADMEIHQGSKGKQQVTVRSGLTREENYRLQQIEKDLLEQKKGQIRKEKSNYEIAKSTYGAVNKKIERARKKDPIRQAKAQMINRNEDLLVQIERLHRAAAVMAQCAWRQNRARRELRRRRARRAAAVRIQALTRGILARRMFARWYVQRNLLVVQWQRRVRRALEVAAWRRRHAWEVGRVVVLQRTVRGFLGRVRWWRARLHAAALAVQRLWRGVVARALADRRWLDGVATLVQAVARRKAARRRVQARREEYQSAASAVARAYLGFRSRRRRAALLFERETHHRADAVQLLTAEYEAARDAASALARRLAARGSGARLAEAGRALAAAYRQVAEYEAELKNLLLQRESLSPRGIEQGWDVQLDKNIREYRRLTTEAKLGAVFDLSLRARGLEEELREGDARLAEAVEYADTLERWREEEVQAAYERLARRAFDTQEQRKILAIGDERRRWDLRWFQPSGKPDKRRRPGRPWDPSVYAGPERQVFCGGLSDLTALGGDPARDARRLRQLPEGGEERLGAVLAKVQAQTHENQVQHYDQLLRPVGQILQKSGFAPFLEPMEHYGPPPRDSDDDDDDRGGGGGGEAAPRAPGQAAAAALPAARPPSFGPGSALETGRADDPPRYEVPKMAGLGQAGGVGQTISYGEVEKKPERIYGHKYTPAIMKLRSSTRAAQQVDQLGRPGRKGARRGGGAPGGGGGKKLLSPLLEHGGGGPASSTPRGAEVALAAPGSARGPEAEGGALLAPHEEGDEGSPGGGGGGGRLRQRLAAAQREGAAAAAALVPGGGARTRRAKALGALVEKAQKNNHVGLTQKNLRQQAFRMYNKETGQELALKAAQDAASGKEDMEVEVAPVRTPREDDRIQWELFDKIEAERYRFEAAKALRKAWRK